MVSPTTLKFHILSSKYRMESPVAKCYDILEKRTLFQRRQCCPRAPDTCLPTHKGAQK